MKLILRDQLNEAPLLGQQSNKDAHELTVACERQARTSLHASHRRASGIVTLVMKKTHFTKGIIPAVFKNQIAKHPSFLNTLYES